MSIRANSQLVLEVFSAIEQRDDKTFRDLLHRDFEIHWPPSLPYGRGDGGTWSETWEPLQPTQLSASWIRALSLLAKTRLSSFGDSEESADRGIGLTERCWAFIEFVTESSPVPRCFTSILWRRRPS